MLVRLSALGWGIDRLSFVHYERVSDRLTTILSEEIEGEACLPGRSAPSPLDALPLAEQPFLARLREPLLQNDLLRQCDPTDRRGRWLLESGWRSSLTFPLICAGKPLGYLFVDGRRPEVFGEDALRQLQPHLELLLLRISDHLSDTATLQATLGLVLDIAGLRHRETASHLERVSLYSRVIALQLEQLRPLPPDFSEDIYRFAAFHDVGKIGIPDSILLKKGPLTATESRLMHTHVALGSALIERVIEALRLQADPSMTVLRQVVAHHHEMLDGSGYPLGLRGEAISLAGRVVAVADIFDALTQERVYKRAFSESEAITTLQQMAVAGKLDPDCVASLVAAQDHCRAIRDHHREAEALAGAG